MTQIMTYVWPNDMYMYALCDNFYTENINSIPVPRHNWKVYYLHVQQSENLLIV